MTINGTQFQMLTNAILSAYPSIFKLRQMVFYRLSKNLDAIALGDSLSEIVFKLIQTAESEGWTHLLVSSASASNPGNSALAEFAQLNGFGISTPSKQDLERIISSKNKFLDIGVWRARLSEIENQVCRVEVILNNGQVVFGTGFLISSDFVITNYHVMKYAIDGDKLQSQNQPWSRPENILCRFDYKKSPGMPKVFNGTEYRLSNSNWLYDFSPISEWDDFTDPKPGLPGYDQLDYAIIKLSEPIGNQPIMSDKSEPNASCRKWIDISSFVTNIVADSPLLIVQHPKAEALKLSVETKAIIGLNDNQTRIKYVVNTEPGSSGSPCFDIEWNLLALHHSGDPDFSSTHIPSYNQGIPFFKIVNLLKERGKYPLE